MKYRGVVGVVIGCLTLGGCGDANLLPPPSSENVVDTSTVYALSTTDLPTPSGFDMFRAVTVRPELGEIFDFVIDVIGGTFVLRPPQEMGVQLEAGHLVQDRPFDEILEAPVEEFVTDSVLELATNTVFVMQSRINREFGCGTFLSLPHYGKFRVIDIDGDAGTVTLEHIVNLNCGYRDLEPGLPLN